VCVLYAAVEAAATEFGSATANDSVNSDSAADAAYQQSALLSTADLGVLHHTPRLSKAPRIFNIHMPLRSQIASFNIFFFKIFFGGANCCAAQVFIGRRAPRRDWMLRCTATRGRCTEWLITDSQRFSLSRLEDDNALSQNKISQ